MENRETKKHPLRGPNLFIFTNNGRINLDNLLKELVIFFKLFQLYVRHAWIFLMFLHIAHITWKNLTWWALTKKIIFFSAHQIFINKMDMHAIKIRYAGLYILSVKFKKISLLGVCFVVFKINTSLKGNYNSNNSEILQWSSDPELLCVVPNTNCIIFNSDDKLSRLRARIRNPIYWVVTIFNTSLFILEKIWQSVIMCSPSPRPKAML